MEDYTKDIENIENEILDQYVNDDNPRPWIIAFSGGKDSTTVLQLVWNSVSRLVRHYVNLTSSHIAIQHQKYSPLDRINLQK